MLNALVRLETLRVTFLKNFESNLQSPLSVKLPVLHTLHIDGARMYTVHQLISSLTAPLTTVHANIVGGCFYPEIAQFISALCAPRNVVFLHTLNLSLTIIDRSADSSECSRPGSFLQLVAPLLRLHSLTSLTVHALVVPRGAVQYTPTDTARSLSMTSPPMLWRARGRASATSRLPVGLNSLRAARCSSIHRSLRSSSSRKRVLRSRR